MGIVIYAVDDGNCSPRWDVTSGGEWKFVDRIPDMYHLKPALKSHLYLNKFA